MFLSSQNNSLWALVFLEDPLRKIIAYWYCRLYDGSLGLGQLNPYFISHRCIFQRNPGTSLSMNLHVSLPFRDHHVSGLTMWGFCCCCCCCSVLVFSREFQADLKLSEDDLEVLIFLPLPTTAGILIPRCHHVWFTWRWRSNPGSRAR